MTEERSDEHAPAPDEMTPEDMAPEAMDPEATAGDGAARTATDPMPNPARADGGDAPDAAEALLFDAPPLPEQERMVEALLFASAEPMTRAQLEDRLPHGSDPAAALELLRKRYETRGVRLTRVGPGWAFRTAPDLGFLMRREATETRRLSRAAIETLAIIAYHQPTTRAEIEEIRGVSVSKGTIDLLIELDWIRLGRRRETPGRPITFVTTNTFLDHFGLESARDLPGIKELRAAGLLESTPPGLEVTGPDGEDGPQIDEETDDMFEEGDADAPEHMSEAMPDDVPAASELTR